MIVKRARDVKQIGINYKLNRALEFEHACRQLKCQFLAKPILIRIHEGAPTSERS